MRIALDYDETYTRDPKLWDAFIELCQRRGHTIECVTMRYEREAVVMPIPVYYTGRKAKQKWCGDRSITFDIWIDDNPIWVVKDA